MHKFFFQKLRDLFTFVLLWAALSGCAHSVDLRASHFAVPVVSEQTWGGHVEFVIAGNTNIELIEDLHTNPPTRNQVSINDSLSLADTFGLNKISFDAGLTVYPGTELFISGSKYGARYQFLNNGNRENVWVAAIMGALGTLDQSTTSTLNGSASSADTELFSTQAGISLGYQLTDVIPYFSYVHELHEAETKIKNSFGSFGPYKDSGNHDTLSVGLCSNASAFSWALEANSVLVDWKRSTAQRYTTYGLRLGYAW